MNEIVEITSNPAFAETRLLETLRSRGIAADVIGNRRAARDAALVTLRVDSGSADVEQRVLAALEDAIAELGRPLVCSTVGPFSYAIHSPAA